MKNKKTALYRFFNREDDLLYIGISLSAVYRLSQHKIKPWYSEISWIDIQWFSDRESAVLAEAEAIRSEFPLFNIMHARDLTNNKPKGWRYADKKVNKDGKIIVKFKKEMLPYVNQSYSGCKICILNKINSERALLLMNIFMSRSWENKICEIDIDTLKSLFELDNKYEKFANIRRRVIEPAIKIINSCSNINVNYSFERTGNKITSIHFQFDFKTEFELAS